MIASGGEDRTVRLWAAETGKFLHVFEGHHYPVTSVAISPKGDLLASGDNRGGLILWNLTDYSVSYENHGLGYLEIKLAFSPDGATLAAVDQVRLHLIPSDAPSRAKHMRFRHFRAMWSAWSPDGKTRALFGSGSFERRDLLVIDAKSGEILAEPKSDPKARFPEYSGVAVAVHGFGFGRQSLGLLV